MSVVERCPLYGGVILCFTVFWDENNCPLFGGVRCTEVSVNGGSTKFKSAIFLLNSKVPYASQSALYIKGRENNCRRKKMDEK